jgi:hypothetical protein
MRDVRSSAAALNDEWYTATRLAGLTKATCLITMALLPATFRTSTGRRTVALTYLLLGVILLTFVALTLRAQSKQFALNKVFLLHVPTSGR